MNEIVIYCDGSCNNQTKKGAWAAIVECAAKNVRREFVGQEEGTTSSRMELSAALEPLKRLKHKSSVRIVSDSQYVVYAFVRERIDYWQRHYWTLQSGGRVKNVDLWKQLLKQTQKHKVSWQWIKGHDKHPENELCHKLAYEARSDYKKKRKKGSADVRNIAFIKCRNCHKTLDIHCYPVDLNNRGVEFKTMCKYCNRDYKLSLTELT